MFLDSLPDIAKEIVVYDIHSYNSRVDLSNTVLLCTMYTNLNDVLETNLFDIKGPNSLNNFNESVILEQIVRFHECFGVAPRICAVLAEQMPHSTNPLVKLNFYMRFDNQEDLALFKLGESG